MPKPDLVPPDIAPASPADSTPEPAPPPAPPPVTGKLGKELDGAMPQGSPHLKGKEPEPAADPKGKGKTKPVDPARYSHLRDGKGRKFNPRYHFTNKEGAPRLTSAGNLWPKPGPRSKHTDSRVFQGIPEDERDPEAPELLVAGERFRATAELTVQTLVTTMTLVAGEDWKLGTVESRSATEEKAALVDAYEVFYRQRGIGEPPWWVGLALANIAYALPRLTKPSTKKRASGLRAWWAKLRDKRRKPADQKRAAQEARQDGPQPPEPYKRLGE